ncbi:MAG: threonine/serine exporter family protein [Candidatus Microthrix sp.]|nr:threonine/serine exporter family protein [Candidatus Microthrix sp.]MBK6439531.1 threonine/serine exporter family protein [Candidatus Microthrix sp.]
MLVLIVIGVATRVILRRQPGGRIVADEAPEHLRPATTPPPEDETAAQLNVRTLDLLLELGRVLIRSEVAVSMVASTLERVANRYGIDNLGTIVFPTSLVLSIPNENSVHTEAAAADTAPLRLDQMDDVTNLIQRRRALR